MHTRAKAIDVEWTWPYIHDIPTHLLLVLLLVLRITLVDAAASVPLAPEAVLLVLPVLRLPVAFRSHGEEEEEEAMPVARPLFDLVC